MGGVYGDQLAFFPELLQEFTVFRMRAALVSGYGERYGEQKVTGYFSWIKGGNMGIEGDLRTQNQQGTFWAVDDTGGKGVIVQGSYLEIDGELFVFKNDDGYSREGGFLGYNLQLVAGPTDLSLIHMRRCRR